MKRLVSLLLHALLWPLSRLPMWAHYALSDYLIFPPLYHLVRYRRRLVRRQLADCFPERSEKERRLIERRFYHFLCDIVVEYVKFYHLPRREVLRRVHFNGMTEFVQQAHDAGKHFSFICLGHFGNWEWLSSFALWMPHGWRASQVYHPLHNAPINNLLLRLRSQYGGQCVPMKDTLRHVMQARHQTQPQCVAFIADQSPTWEAMHHWTTFLHHPTSFFIGAEKLGKRVDAAICYARISRPRRGYYQVDVVPLSMDAARVPDYGITDAFAQMLEEQIEQMPHLWLWTHNRWKRTRAQWEERQATLHHQSAQNI